MSGPLLLTEHGWFWCAHCKRDFPKGWSDSEAKGEHDDNFPGLPIENSTLICDDCYLEMQAWFEQRPWRAAEARREAERQAEELRLKTAQKGAFRA